MIREPSRCFGRGVGPAKYALFRKQTKQVRSKNADVGDENFSHNFAHSVFPTQLIHLATSPRRLPLPPPPLPPPPPPAAHVFCWTAASLQQACRRWKVGYLRTPFQLIISTPPLAPPHGCLRVALCLDLDCKKPLPRLLRLGVFSSQIGKSERPVACSQDGVFRS